MGGGEHIYIYIDIYIDTTETHEQGVQPETQK